MLRISLRWKTTILLLGFIAPLSAILLLNVRAMDHLSSRLTTVRDQTFPLYSEAISLVAAFEETSRQIDDAVTMGESLLVARAEQGREAFSSHLRNLIENGPESRKPTLDALGDDFGNYYADARKLSLFLIDCLEDSEDLSKCDEAARVGSAETARQHEKLEADLNRLLTREEREVDAFLSWAADGMKTESRQAFLIGIVFFVIITIVIGVFTQRFVSSIRALSRATGEVAKGNLDLEMMAPVRSRDEIGELWGSFQTMTEGLKQTTVSKGYVDNILESMVDPLIVVNRDGTVQKWNHAALDLLGYEEEVLTGMPIEQILVEESVESSGHSEEILLTKSGDRIPVSVSTSEMNQGGRAEGFVCVAQNITDRKRAEEALRQAKESAEDASRAKSQFLANMSHEIRTPMNGVMGMLDLLSETDLNVRQSHFAETARRSSEDLLRIINDILDLSKIEAGKLELDNSDFDVRDAVEETVVLFAERAHRQGLEIACHLEEEVPVSVCGDRLRLTQILSNLVANAVKFTERGEVVARVRCVQEAEGEVFLRFEVTDTGVGIEPEEQDRIFEVFSQADGSSTRRFGGTGLGLAISRQLVEMMGGRIGVESRPGEGSTFWFTARLEKGSALNRSLRPSCHDLGNLRVLIVDDNKTNQEILDQQVLSWGMRNDTVGSGPEALERLRRAAGVGDPYDMVILDYHMPGMDGIEVARTMEQDPILRNLRRIILTSVDQRMGEEERREAGVSAWLTKPVRASQLYNCLVTVMEGLAPAAPKADALLQAQDRFDACVLLAEDNPVNQEVALSMLENLGCRVEVVSNGGEVLETASRTDFDLILMDCQMPEMDGYQATEGIRESERAAGAEKERMPIVALTAHAMEGARDKCLAAGMDGYLAKPFSQGQLAEVLACWLKPVPATGSVSAEADSQEEKASSSDGAEPASIDHKALETIRALQRQGKPDLLVRVINIYLEDSLRLLESLCQAMSRGDGTELKLQAHSLKSSSANVGALRLAGLCKELEAIGEVGSMDGVDHRISRIEEEYRSVRNELTVELERTSA